MNILLDTNVLLDFLTFREPFSDDACVIMDHCCKKVVNGFIAAHTIMDAIYILRKQIPLDKRRQLMLDFMEFLTVVGIDQFDLMTVGFRHHFMGQFDPGQFSLCAILVRAGHRFVHADADDLGLILRIVDECFFEVVECRASAKCKGCQGEDAEDGNDSDLFHRLHYTFFTAGGQVKVL